ncbi:hypothetical protein AV530_008023 [Patagioenas fasciata monilis]|uniref:Uncharacterized protein n=1 Tax=Patagioenas fasciata monilis TaxID=372326 RepID=A0A1V4KU54_PATFA|nr:hypothetical protein AV530_008023 [Patagioenas fasciata monilis]
MHMGKTLDLKETFQKECASGVDDDYVLTISELVSGYVTDNSSIYPLERLNTAETEKTYVDKLDKNAVFYLNYLPLNEYPAWPVCYCYAMQKNALS